MLSLLKRWVMRYIQYFMEYELINLSNRSCVMSIVECIEQLHVMTVNGRINKPRLFGVNLKTISELALFLTPSAVLLPFFEKICELGASNVNYRHCSFRRSSLRNIFSMISFHFQLKLHFGIDMTLSSLWL